MDKDASWFDGISLYKRNYEIGKRIRDYEARNVRRFIDEAHAEGKPVIVTGDLNDCAEATVSKLSWAQISRMLGGKEVMGSAGLTSVGTFG